MLLRRMPEMGALLYKFLKAARIQIEASDFSHSCMMTLTIRLAGVGHGSRLWISECRSSQIGNTCWERFCLEHGIQPDSQLIPDTILGGGAGAFNTSVFVTVVDLHVSRCAVAARADGHGCRFLAAFRFGDASY